MSCDYTDDMVSTFPSQYCTYTLCIIPSSNDNNYTIIHSSNLFISSSNVDC